MEELERHNRVRLRLDREEIMRWHSLNCVCDECLDADLATYLFNPRSNFSSYFDLKGLFQ